MVILLDMVLLLLLLLLLMLLLSLVKHEVLAFGFSCNC